MSRIFRRGELKQAVLVVVAGLGEAHGYAIMSELEARVEGGWKASPGAIYPALLALVEGGYLRTEERDGVQVYVVTAAGREAVSSASWGARWESLTARAEEADRKVAVGSLLDGFAAGSALRRRLADPDQQREIEAILEAAHRDIEVAIEKGDTDG
jgi:DNA-binding PadR family transcriptional regulator